MLTKPTYTWYYPIVSNTNRLNNIPLQIFYVDFIVARQVELKAMELPVLDQSAMKLLIDISLKHLSPQYSNISLPQWYDTLCKFWLEQEEVYKLLDQAVTEGYISSYIR